MRGMHAKWVGPGDSGTNSEDFVLVTPASLTDDPSGLEQSKKIFNILGDRVETVTPWLASKVLSNDRPGASFRWLTTAKVLGRFLTAGFNRRDLFALESSSQ